MVIRCLHTTLVWGCHVVQQVQPWRPSFSIISVRTQGIWNSIFLDLFFLNPGEAQKWCSKNENNKLRDVASDFYCGNTSSKRGKRGKRFWHATTHRTNASWLSERLMLIPIISVQTVCPGLAPRTLGFRYFCSGCVGVFRQNLCFWNTSCIIVDVFTKAQI